jgi:hypothetical protein
MTGLLNEPIPKLYIESMDGSLSIPLDDTMGLIRLPGSTGLEMPPVEVISATIPGVPGSVVQDVRVQDRPVFIPLYAYSAVGQREFRELLDLLRSVIDPMTGSFKLVGASLRGIRELVVTYESGLEGNDEQGTESVNWAKFGLKCTAHEPFARAREDRSLEYRVVSVSSPFLGVAGGTDVPFDTAMLSSNSVIGSGMPITIDSEVPVYPTVELLGAMTSFLGTLSSVVTNPNGTTTTIVDREWSVSVPSGVPAGQTLRMVTDPRNRSIRLNGALAAGMIARGSTLRPFYPGTNVLNVVAPGGTTDTRITITWRDLYRSLW